MAVTKTFGPEAIDLAEEGQVRSVGENRVQEGLLKRGQRPEASVCWELIGPLQSNKVRDAVETFDRIQTVDRQKLVSRLDRYCVEHGRSDYRVLMQVNVGQDPSKSGIDVERAFALAESIKASESLQLEGLMTIGAFTQDESVVRGTFSRLRELRDRLESELGQALPELSMGMSGDLEWAIEEGSTLVRVGSALYGSRG